MTEAEIGDGRGRGEAAPVDGAAALRDVAECLRFLACGWTLDPREREACLRLLEAGIPGVAAADLEAARKIIEQAAQRCLAGRSRDRAAELSVRLSERAEVLLGRTAAG